MPPKTLPDPGCGSRRRRRAYALQSRQRTTIGAVHLKVPHASASVAVRGESGTTEMVNSSTVSATVSV